MIQCLDEKSLSLVIRDAADDGRKALGILRDHYAGVGKPRVISLYTESTSLIKSSGETVTEYIMFLELTPLQHPLKTVVKILLIVC